MRAARGKAAALEAYCEAILRSPVRQSCSVIEEGQARGDFRPVDPLHFVPSMIAIIVFHFTNAPVLRMVKGIDPWRRNLWLPGEPRFWILFRRRCFVRNRLLKEQRN